MSHEGPALHAQNSKYQTAFWRMSCNGKKVYANHEALGSFASASIPFFGSSFPSEGLASTLPIREGCHIPKFACLTARWYRQGCHWMCEMLIRLCLVIATVHSK